MSDKVIIKIWFKQQVFFDKIFKKKCEKEACIQHAVRKSTKTIKIHDTLYRKMDPIPKYV